MNDTPTSLPPGDDLPELQSGDDLAQAALTSRATAGTTDDDDVTASNTLAETLTALQQVIERNAQELDRLLQEIKEKREMLNNIFDNDAQLTEAQEQQAAVSTKLKERKAQIQADPQAISLKVQLSELMDDKKNIEETLSGHLINYHTITGVTSFDTSDGDQWEFNIRAKVKSRKK